MTLRRWADRGGSSSRSSRATLGFAWLAIVLFAASLLPHSAAAQRSLLIERFDETVRVEESGWIEVREEIRVRFQGTWNGIFRLIYWDEYEELYRNVTGDEWEMPIRVATARIVLPANLHGLRTASWTGGYGAAENGASVTELEYGFYF
jgi:hypothetical protein